MRGLGFNYFGVGVVSRKVIVSREWHKKAVSAIKSQKKHSAFINALTIFLNTKLTPEQQKQLESEIEDYISRYINEHGD